MLVDFTNFNPVWIHPNEDLDIYAVYTLPAPKSWGIRHFNEDLTYSWIKTQHINKIRVLISTSTLEGPFTIITPINDNGDMEFGGSLYLFGISSPMVVFSILGMEPMLCLN